MPRWSSPLRAAVVLSFASVLAACGAHRGVLSTAHASQPGMPCREATRIARGTLLRLGYVIETVEPAEPGAPGLVTGHKETGWAPSQPEPDEIYRAQIRITCSDQGSEFEASSDAPFASRLEFRNAVPQVISELSERRTVRPRLKENPEAGMVIKVEPLRSARATNELGIDPTVSGVTPVLVRLENRTERSYRFDRSRVILVSQDGTRSRPLSAQRVAATFGAEVAQQLDSRLIAEGEIVPNETLSGFLYFPAAAYRRATLLLVDQESDEAEGFSVEF